LQAGEPGRMLANGDLLRVEAISGDGVTVSRIVRTGPAGTAPGWSGPFCIRNRYAAGHCDLGYALTWDTGEGRAASARVRVVSGQRPRRGLYVAMTRGQQRNEVYAYPGAGEPDGIVPVSVPDPEVARQRRLQADQAGAVVAAGLDSEDPVTILARVVRRDDTD